MTAPKAQVFIVDDHAILRHGMAMLINAEPDMAVLDEAEDSVDAISRLGVKGQPDIVLVDLTLKTQSGLELIKSIHARFRSVPVLIVSMHDESVYAERALRAGARGYVMKQEPGEVLIAAIREVLQGHYYFSKKIQKSLMNRLTTGASGADPLVSSLTPTEFEVLHLIGTGHSSQEISAHLGRSIKTIEVHRYNIKTKLQLKNGAELVRYAMQWISGVN